MYLTNTELKSFFKVISQRKRIGRGGERRGGSKRRDGFNEQFRVSMTLLLCPPSLCEEGEKAQACVLLQRSCSPCAPTGQGHRCATAEAAVSLPAFCANGARFPFTSRRRHRSVSCFSHWLSPMLRVLVTMRSLLPH